MVEVVGLLNMLPATAFPKFAVMPTADAAGLRQAAQFDPASGQGVASEPDVTNRVGSAMLLAMLLPERFGVPLTAPLRCFGYPPEDALVQLSATACPRSGHGPDNRRQNVWEACLNHWQDEWGAYVLREKVLVAQCAVASAIDYVDPHRRYPVWMVIRSALQRHDLPRQLGRRPRGLDGNMV